MSMILIIVLAIAIVALFVLRAKQNKVETTPKKSKTPEKQATSKASTNTTVPPTAKSESNKSKAKVDIENLNSKLDILIADKQYSKAEGLINVSLKEDHTAHTLYFKLLEIYQLQNDNFAVKQLFDNVQKQNLNEVYQKLYSSHEEFKQSDAFQNQANDTLHTSSESASTYHIPSDTLEETTSLHTQDATAHTDLDFDTLSFKDAASATEIPATSETESHTLDFNLSSSTTTAQEPVETSTLEFKLDEPTTSQTDSEAQTLDFNLDTTNTATTNEPTLEFDATATPSQDFLLDEELSRTESQPPQIQSNAIDIDETLEFADPNDPITQAFPILSQLDPIDLNIDLAEQYIQLGEPQAAKALLQEYHDTLSNAQRSKIEQLLQKIA